jgi:hypothetical protein
VRRDSSSTPEESRRPILRLVHDVAAEDVPAVMHTIKDVADACGLPQPAIAQLVARTWTQDGWMYTPDQLHSAIEIARSLGRSRGT